MADILREITAWTLILTGLATCLSAGGSPGCPADAHNNTVVLGKA